MTKSIGSGKYLGLPSIIGKKKKNLWFHQGDTLEAYQSLVLPTLIKSEQRDSHQINSSISPYILYECFPTTCYSWKWTSKDDEQLLVGFKSLNNKGDQLAKLGQIVYKEGI